MGKKTYKKLGDYIEQVWGRNDDLAITKLMGISTAKHFLPSIANTIGTNMSNYKVVRHNDFVYVPDTSRRGDKIAIAKYNEQDDCIVSQAYTPFRVIDENELDPDYLMMWFRRPEFDRYARFHSHGSVREIFSWEEMCNVSLPIPDINEQRKIVAEYQTIEKRIENNNRLIKVLEETAQNIFLKTFPNYSDEEMKLGLLFTPLRGKNIILENCITGNVPVIAAGKEPSAYHNQSNTDAPVITISSSGANAGFVRLNRQKIWASDCSYIDKKQCKCIFFAYVCLKLLQEKIFSLQEGTGQPHIYPSHITEIKIGQIDDEKISEYELKVENIFKTMFTAQEENSRLQKILPLLLSKLS